MIFSFGIPQFSQGAMTNMHLTITTFGQAVYAGVVHCDVWIAVIKELQRRKRRMWIGVIWEELVCQLCQLKQLKILAFLDAFESSENKINLIFPLVESPSRTPLRCMLLLLIYSLSLNLCLISSSLFFSLRFILSNFLDLSLCTPVLCFPVLTLLFNAFAEFHNFNSCIFYY